MLNRFWYGKGKRIKTAEQAKNCELGFVLEGLYGTSYHVDKELLVQPHYTDKQIQSRIDKNNYRIYERIKITREPIFSEEIDFLLNDVIVENNDNLDEYDCEETNMDRLLKELNKHFNITLKENKDEIK